MTTARRAPRQQADAPTTKITQRQSAEGRGNVRAEDLSGKEWALRLSSAVGSRVGNTRSRARFGKVLLQRLASGLPAAFRHANAHSDLSELTKIAEDALRAIARLRNPLKQRSIVALRIDGRGKAAVVRAVANRNRKLPIELAHDGYFDLALVQTYLVRVLRCARKERAALAPVKRGPQNRAAVLIASVIAKEYERHFGRPPSCTKGDGAHGDRSTPFERVCHVVDAILASRGVKLTSPAQAEAVKAVRALRS